MPMIAGRSGRKGQEVWSPKGDVQLCHSRCLPLPWADETHPQHLSPDPVLSACLDILHQQQKSDFSRRRRAGRGGKRVVLLPLCVGQLPASMSSVGPGRTCVHYRSGVTRTWQRCSSAVKPLWQGVTKGLAYLVYLSWKIVKVWGNLQ